MKVRIRGSLLKNILKIKNMTILELEELSGVGRVSIWRMLTNQGTSQVGTADKIERALGLEPGSISDPVVPHGC